MSDPAIDSIILSIAAVASNLFVLGYLLLAPWYKSETGRAAWSIMFALSALLDVALLAYWFHWTVAEWVARTIYVAIAGACWMKLGAFVQEQLLSRHEDGSE